MKDLRKKVAYLQGLMAGMDIQEASKEGKILSQMVGVMDDFADSIQELKTGQDDLVNQVEELEDGVTELEEKVFDLDEDYIEVDCPHCHEKVAFSSDILDDDATIEVTCPSCDTVVYVHDESYEMTEDTGEAKMYGAPLEDDI